LFKIEVPPLPFQSMYAAAKPAAVPPAFPVMFPVIVEVPAFHAMEVLQEDDPL
jgi:hypothetical protein